jgi:hypothetical protein
VPDGGDEDETKGEEKRRKDIGGNADKGDEKLNSVIS